MCAFRRGGCGRKSEVTAGIASDEMSDNVVTTDNVVVFPEKSGDDAGAVRGTKYGDERPSDTEHQGKGNGRGKKAGRLQQALTGTRPAHLVTALHYLAREAEEAGFVLAAHLVATAARSVREEAVARQIPSISPKTPSPIDSSGDEPG